MQHNVKFWVFALNNALTILGGCGQPPRKEESNCFVEYLISLRMLTGQWKGPFLVCHIINNLSRENETMLKKDSVMSLSQCKVMLYKWFVNK